MTLRHRALQSAPLVGFGLGIVFLAMSLAGYDPADPPGHGAEPANEHPTNPCGPVGAAMAHAMFTTIGWASWLVPPALLVVNLLVARRRSLPDRTSPSIGFAMVVVVAAATVYRLAPTLRPSPPVGSGGYAGAVVAIFLERTFGNAGLILILAAAGLFGLALCHEVLIGWPVQEARDWLRTRLGRVGSRRALAPPSATGGLVRVASGDWDDPLDMAEATAPAETRVHAPIPVNGSAGTAMAMAPAMPAPAIVGSRAPAGIPILSGAAVPAAHGSAFSLPPMDLLEPPAAFPVHEHEAKIHSRAMLLERTLLDFGYQVRVVQIATGPVITQFEVELEAGLRVSKVIGLADDLAIALAVPSVRIVAPIPGKTTVGIEVPNDHRNMVRLGDVIAGVGDRFRECRIPLFLGKDAKGVPLVYDLADMPHLLMAGRTGTGKSVCLNAMILSILMTKRPDEVKVILIDPKKVELSQYKRIPHLMHPVVVEMKKAESLLAWACEKMDERYEYLRRAEVRNIQSYNKLGAEVIYSRLAPEDDAERQRIPTHMPYIVIVVDELAEMMMTAEKEAEQHIVRLAQLARAVGIHLILATQKPTVDVVTGLIKGNLPARIAFQVASRSDSRVVLDEMGADRLLGNGDMLFLIPGTSNIIRAQGTYVSDLEVTKVCQYLERYPPEFSKELLQLQVGGGPGGKDRGAALKERDDLYEPAIEIVIREGRGSCSLLQRALGIGYGRAARLIDFMAEDGIVGEYKSGSAREVLYSWEEWEALKNGGADKGEAAVLARHGPGIPGEES
jgi:S-DNA-T family DNA segregation ATPase FtsK/SpoIIIE